MNDEYKADYPIVSIEMITPEKAQQMLNTSIGNRELRKNHVDRLAGAIIRGEWRITSQGVGFDKNGHLRDGHHRLNAIIKSGVAISTTVVRGLPENAYEVIDTGALRNLSDLLHEDKRATDVYRLAYQFSYGENKPTVDQLSPLIDSKFGKTTKELIEFCGSSRKFYSTAGFKLAAICLSINGGDKDYIFGQYRALVALDFDSMSEASKTLVRKVDSLGVNSHNARIVAAIAFKVLDQKNSDYKRVHVYGYADMCEIVRKATDASMGIQE